MSLDEMTFGSMIRSLRMQNNMTQAVLAQKLGITDKAVSKWERDLSYPDISLFPALADVLGVSIDDLFKRCSEEADAPRLVQILQMSHDIRTPLSIILGYTNLAEKYRDDPERLLHYLKNIRLSGEYLLTVIDHLMAVARQNNGANGSVLPFPEGGALDSSRGSPYEISGAADRYDFSGKRILLAEDIELNREIALELLKATGAAVEFAEDGRICLTKLACAEAGYYDLILMDICMPNMNGIEATRRIRALADPIKARIPIVAMTANVLEADRTDAFDAGMNDFTEKPILVERFYETLKKYL